jgi:hypothetical protein
VCFTHTMLYTDVLYSHCTHTVYYIAILYPAILHIAILYIAILHIAILHISQAGHYVDPRLAGGPVAASLLGVSGARSRRDPSNKELPYLK